MIKKFSLLICIVTIFLCGCTNNINKEEITFSSWGSVTETKVIKQVISDFEKQNPNINVHFMHIPQNYFQKIQLLFASNTAPDVIFINNLYLPIYASRLEDLSELVEKDKFYPQTIEGLSIDGKVYGIPRDVSNQVFYVNTDIIPLPNSEWTLKDLLKLSSAATKKGVYGVSYEENIYWALPYLRYFGGGVLDKNYNLIIDSPESQAGIEFYKNLVTKYKCAPSRSRVGSSTLAQMFIDKKIAFYLSGRWLYPKIKEKANFNWAVINFPIGKSPLPCDVSGWAISKNSKHKIAALKFVQFISGEQSSEYFTKTGLIVPARIETSKLIDNNEHNQKIFIEIIRNSQSTPVNKKYKKITDEIDDNIFR